MPPIARSSGVVDILWIGVRSASAVVVQDAGEAGADIDADAGLRISPNRLLSMNKAKSPRLEYRGSPPPMTLKGR